MFHPYIWLLLLFILPREASLNGSRILLNLIAIIEDAPKWFMLLTPLIILIPGKLLISIKMWKGDKGQCCRRSLLPLKRSVGLPFTRGAIQRLQIPDDTYQMKEEQKPNWWRISNNKECQTLSKAFAMYILMIIPLSLLAWLEWMASWTIILLSTICLFSINLFWLSKITLGEAFSVHLL